MNKKKKLELKRLTAKVLSQDETRRVAAGAAWCGSDIGCPSWDGTCVETACPPHSCWTCPHINC